jgi:protein TonB
VERHKGYPPSARTRHETGTAQLAFTLDRNGKVLASRIVRTSGFSALDQETIDTVRRAQPFPPPPPNMPGETFDFTVPIRFNIR